MLSYPYIQKSKFDVLLIRQSRVREDLNPIAQAVNHAALTRVREFYANVRDGTVDGYRLIYQTDYGLAFVSEALYQRFFVSANDAAADV